LANYSRRLPFINSHAKQPHNTDRELRSSSFPFAVPIIVPISRSVSSRSPYQFVVCWPSVRRRTDIALMKKEYLAGVDEEGVVDSSYRALRRPIVRYFVQTRARSWRRRTREASPIARSGGGAKGNRAKERKKPARWNRESRDLYLHSRTPLAYMPSFPLQMHSYVKYKVQMHNDWRGFFLEFYAFLVNAKFICIMAASTTYVWLYMRACMHVSR